AVIPDGGVGIGLGDFVDAVGWGRKRDVSRPARHLGRTPMRPHAVVAAADLRHGQRDSL
ncbi:MAG: hypothetical protein AVDCRST_MAG91-3222, partial [uncultured Sphingomonadaceae bacterium]